MSKSKSVINKKYKTALYVRLSREDGDDKVESNSITNQRQMLQDYVKRNIDEYEVYDIYADENYTGTNFKRPRFQAMLNDIENGLVECVICKDLSRFGRDYIDTGHYLERVFPKYNVRFIALNDNIDSFKQAYDMLLPVKNIFNQQYAMDISKKVQSAFKVKQSNGSFIGAFASYGYIKDEKNHNKLIIDEYAAQIVRRIFKMYLEGNGKIRIAKILNSENIPCPSEYKNTNGMNYTNGQKIGNTTYWTYSTIHRLLLNEMYTGSMIQNKTIRKMKGKAQTLPKDEWIIVENTHESIIDSVTWDKVRNLLNKNTRQLNFNQNVSIFAGFLKCKECGRAFAKNKRGNVTYYICGSYKKYGASVCSPHTLRHDDLEDIIKLYIKLIKLKFTKLKDIIESEQIITNMPNDNIKNEIEKNSLAINKIYNLKKGIYEDYKDGILTKEEYLRYKEDYEKTEIIYKNKIKTLEESKENVIYNIFENEWVKRFLTDDEIGELSRERLADFIKEIVVDENMHMEYTLTCDDAIKDLLDSISIADK